MAEDEVCKAGQGSMSGAMNGRWNRLDILREERHRGPYKGGSVSQRMCCWQRNSTQSQGLLGNLWSTESGASTGPCLRGQ